MQVRQGCSVLLFILRLLLRIKCYQVTNRQQADEVFSQVRDHRQNCKSSFAYQEQTNKIDQ